MHIYIHIHTYIGISTVGPLSNSTVREGKSTTITCAAIGSPPVTVVWSKVDGSLSSRASVSDSVSVPTGYGNVTRVSVNLTITNASREDTGLHVCFANDSIGDDYRNITIVVQCKFTM